MRHGHESSLMVGCPDCIKDAREREETARWETAPLCLVTWECSYCLPEDDESGDTRRLSFTLERRCPSDADVWEIDTRYAGDTGEAFAMALPESVSMNDTTYACEYMVVESVTVGKPINVATPVFERTPLW